MFRKFQIPRSILRNMLILAMSVAVLLTIKSVTNFVLAQNNSADEPDRYVDLLVSGKDFDSECGSGRERDTLYDHLRDPTDVLVAKYHDTMNCIFNKRIELMVDKMLSATSTEPLTDEQMEEISASLSSPEPLKNDNGEVIGRKKCEAVNGEPPLSTYCLAMSGVNEYFAFRKAMLIEKVKAEQDTIQRFQTVSGANQGGGAFLEQRVGSGLQDYAAKMERVDLELKIAVQALDQGLAAYNELQMALPLHKKYKEIIKSLEHYRDKVSGIRTETEFFPDTFIDVMTTQCT